MESLCESNRPPSNQQLIKRRNLQQGWANELILRNGGGAIHNFGVFKGEDLSFIHNTAQVSGHRRMHR